MRRMGFGRSVITRTTPVAVGVTFALLTLCVSGAAGAAPVTATSTAYANSWAYGAVRSVTYAGTNASGIPYQATALVGFTVVLNETLGPGSVIQVEVSRTMGATLSVLYCFPSCRNPEVTGSVSYHAVERIESFANFTTNASVTEGSASVAAIGLLNSTASLNGSLHLTTQYTDLGVVERDRVLDINVTGSDAIDFATPLGLFPTNLTPGLAWSSTANFSAIGQSAWTLFLARTGVGSVHLSGSGTVPTSGDVTVLGSYAPDSNITLGGAAFAAINLTVEGPFAVREGFILVPVGSDLFGGTAQPFSGNETGATTAVLSHLDVRPSLKNHLGIGASEWIWGAASTNPATGLAAPSGIAPAATGSDESPEIAVQGEPESTPGASQVQNCLQTGVGCPASAGSPTHPWLALILGAGVVVVVVAGTLILVAERRRMPPPRFPNATLYPPGATGARGASPDGTSPPASPPAEDDPLSHLW